MDLILLSLRIIIGLIFLSSSISKLSNMTEHIVVIRKYQILPKNTISYFSYLDAYIELIASLLILFGYKMELASTSLLVLITLYTLAIVINLLKGNTDMSCGCGGFVGNHRLNWFLPIRNLIIGILVLVLLSNPNYIFSIDSLLNNMSHVVDSISVFSVIVSSFLFMIVSSNLNSLININRLFIEIFKEKVK